MAELHIIGTLVGASEFPKSSLCCHWEVTTSESWSLVEGESTGQTHVDVPLDQDLCVWSHPIDLHYATTSIAGWPKIRVQVYHQDMFGRNELYGYGFAHIPTSPGVHMIDIATWRPVGTPADQLWSYYLGATPQLKNMDLVDNPADRFRLITTSMGKVHVEVAIVMRNFESNGMVF
ncbi:B9 domain-containing protein [Entophlyctis helioformis]|nr:B9 domain-containing protein [Entophlyctis helioformis]